jgi:dinuclear metal center YbgI/SA1388 family protein
MTIKDITDYLEQVAPLAYQESYDNCGLITGDANMVVSKAIVTLDCTEDVIEEAIKQGAELVIAHHPIIFSGIKKLNGKNYVERTVIKAIKNNIAIYAIHTNLDNVINGVNAMIAERLELERCSILSPKQSLMSKLITYVPESHLETVKSAIFDAGAGYLGNYSHTSFSTSGIGTFKGNENTSPFVGNAGELEKVEELRLETIVPNRLGGKVIQALLSAHPYEEVAYDLLPLANASPSIGSGMVGMLKSPLSEQDFLKHLKTTMQTGTIRYTSVGEKLIHKVAVCGGSGQFLLPISMAMGADAFVTADFKYHEFFDAEGQLLIADIGHYESEQFTKNIIYKLLSEKFPNFAVLISKINTNPVNYY